MIDIIAIVPAHRKTQDEFIREVIAKHGDQYDLSKVIYTGSRNKVEVSCLEEGHGTWNPVAQLLLSHGCRKCGSERRAKLVIKTQEQFLDEVIAKHGNGIDKLTCHIEKNSIKQ